MKHLQVQKISKMKLPRYRYQKLKAQKMKLKSQEEVEMQNLHRYQKSSSKKKPSKKKKRHPAGGARGGKQGIRFQFHRTAIAIVQLPLSPSAPIAPGAGSEQGSPPAARRAHRTREAAQP